MEPVYQRLGDLLALGDEDDAAGVQDVVGQDHPGSQIAEKGGPFFEARRFPGDALQRLQDPGSYQPVRPFRLATVPGLPCDLDSRRS